MSLNLGSTDPLLTLLSGLRISARVWQDVVTSEVTVELSPPWNRTEVAHVFKFTQAELCSGDRVAERTILSYIETIYTQASTQLLSSPVQSLLRRYSEPEPWFQHDPSFIENNIPPLADSWEFAVCDECHHGWRAHANTGSPIQSKCWAWNNQDGTCPCDMFKVYL